MNRSNNDIMFDCELDIYSERPDHLNQVKAFISDYYQYNGCELNNNFSHDNWKLVACWLNLFAKTCKPVPLFGAHSARFWDNFTFFLYCRYQWMIFLKPIISFFLILSVIRDTKTNSRGQKEITTSGDRLAFYIANCFQFKWTLLIMNKIVEKNPVLKSWENIQTIYLTKRKNVLSAFRKSKLRGGDLLDISRYKRLP